MNEYIVSERMWLGSSGNMVLLSNTDSLESGGYFSAKWSDYSVGDFFEANCILMRYPGTLTIGGNFEGGNVSYTGKYVQQYIAAIEYTISGGMLYIAAQTGAISEASKAVDANVTISTIGSYNSENSEGPQSSKYHLMIQNADVFAVRALGQLNVKGSLSGVIEASGINDFSKTVIVDDDLAIIGGIMNGNSARVVGVYMTNEVVGSALINRAELLIENNSSATINSVASSIIKLYEGDDKVASIANNVISAYGMFAEYNTVSNEDRVIEYSHIEVNGYLGGVWNIANEKTRLDYSLRKDEAPGPEESAGAKADSRYPAKVSISNNVIGAYGMAADAMDLSSFTGEINVTNTDTEIYLDTMGGDPTKDLGRVSTISNNKIEAIGFDGTEMNVLKSFTGTINVTNMNNAILFSEEAGDCFASGNEVAAYGLRLKTKGVGAGKLVAERNFGGTINLVNSDSDSSKANVLYDSDQYTYRSYTYGIYAEASITIKGGLNTNITSYTDNVLNSEEWSESVGIFSESLTAQYIGANITVSGNSLVNKDGIFRNIGIWANTLTNDNDKIVDFTGSMAVNGGLINFGFIGGGKSGINLRISGSVNMIDGENLGYAIVAGDYNPDNSIRFGTNDYIELAAGSDVKGFIELMNGDNTIIVDSNASYLGAVFADLGTLNFSIKLNNNTLSGNVASGTPICSLADDSTLLTSTTTVTIDLTDAAAGEEYILFYGNLDGKWAEREISVTYQGHTITMLTGGSYSDSFFSVSSKINKETISFTVDSLENLGLPQVAQTGIYVDAKKDLVKFSWATESNTAFYLLEYSIDGGNSIVVKIDGKKTEFDVNSIEAGSNVTWRIRRQTTGNRVSNWTKTETFEVPKHSAIIKNPESPGYSSETGIAGSAVIDLKWNAVESTFGVEVYEVEYCTSPTIGGLNWNGKTFKKEVTGTSVLVSGLSNLDFVGWRIRAVDTNGNAGEWVYGDTLRVYVGDVTAPEFDPKSLYSTVKFVPNTNAIPGVDDDKYLMDVTVHWAPAVDVDGKSGLAGYEVSYRIAGSKDSWITIRFDADATGGMIKGLKNGAYEWKITASDYAGNKTQEFAGQEWKGDYVAPVFNYGENLQSEVIVDGAYNNKIMLTWNAAIEDKNSLSFQSGMKEYILYYKKPGESDEQATKVIITDLANAYTFSSKEDNLNDGTYLWWVEAYDNVENVTITDKSSFQVDTTAPSGGMVGEVEGPFFTIKWKDVGITNSFGEVTTRKEVESISVSFTVPGHYTDPNGVIYVMQCSKNSNFTDAVEFEFDYNPLSPTTTITFDNSLEHGAGALAKMGTFYYRLQVKDDIGNASGAWVTFGAPHKMVDPITGLAIVDTDTPTAVSVGSMMVSSPEDKVLNFTWAGASDVFGVQYYEINFSAKSGGESIKVSNIKELEYVTKTLKEGKYSWSVRAVDWYKHAGAWSTSTTPFVVDITDPVFNTSSVTVKTVNRDICVTWEKATDNIELSHYELLYATWNEQTGGFGQWTEIRVAADKTSYWFDNWQDGKYSYIVRAVDSAGNTSNWSDEKNAVINTGNDPGNSFSTAKVLNWGTPFTDLVGRTDSADYLKFNLAGAGIVTFTVNGVWAEEDNGASVKATIYNANGKKLKDISIKSGSGKLSLLLDKVGDGGCYLVITPNKSGDNNVANYTVKADVDYFPAATDNNTIAKATKVNLTDGKITIASKEGMEDCWVGFGDAADVYKVSGTAAGTIDLTISGLDGKVTITIYDASGKKVKSVSTKDSKLIFDDLMVSKDYYVSIVSGDNGKGKENTDYIIDIKEDYFPTATDNNSFDKATGVTMVDGKLSITDVGTVRDCWVGFGDAADFYKVSSDGAGMLTYLSLSDVSSKLTITIYDGNGKKIKSVNTNKNGQVFTNLLLNGDYYISITSGDKGKGKENTDYAILGDISYFPKATDNNSFDKATNVNLVDGKLVLSNSETCWVGYGDSSDFYLVNGISAGSLNLSISGLDAKAIITVYDVNGKKLKSVTANSAYTISDLLVTGKFYISVASADKGKGKENTDYVLDITDKYFPKATDNNSIDKATNVTLVNGSLIITDPNNCWVGYGDASDYYLVNGAAAGVLTLSVEGLDSKATITVYDVNGKKIKSISAKGGSLVLDGLLVTDKFYISISSGDNGKGKENTDYIFDIKSDYFPKATANNTIGTATAKDMAASGELVIAGGEERGCWVGYGDAADFYKINTTAGTVDLKIEGLSGKVTVAIYDGNGKQIKSVSTSADKLIFDDLLVSGNFYISVTSGDKGKGKENTDYILNVKQDIFPVEKVSNNTFNTAEKVKIAETGTVELNGWVGYGDVMDYFKVDMAYDSTSTISIKGLTGTVSVTLYDETCKKIKSFTMKADGIISAGELDSGVFYLSIASGDNGKGKMNTYYDVVMDSRMMVENSGNNSMGTALKLDLTTGATATDGAVGYGDMADFFSFELATDGSVKCSLAFDNESMEIGENVAWTFFDAAGNKNIASGLNFECDLSAGVYYASVEMMDEKKVTNYNMQIALK